MLLFDALEVRWEVESLIPQRFKAAKDVEHESVEVPPLFLATGQRIGEEVEEHGLATADFAIEEHTSWGLDRYCGFLHGNCASECKGGRVS